METEGFTIFPYDPQVAAWAKAALALLPDAQSAGAVPADQMRHGGTWYVGLDALDNAADGSVRGVPLTGAWRAHVPDLPLHPAQLSVVYPGYPQQDPEESDANHRFRIRRKAAHVDGLLPIGPNKRRFAMELHAYILALPLNHCAAAPTVVWRGSHTIMQAALREAIRDQAPETVDVTEAYQAARRVVFNTCEMVPLQMVPGQAALIHRFALHGTEVWQDDLAPYRAVAFFRPEVAHPKHWLEQPFSGPENGSEFGPNSGAP